MTRTHEFCTPVPQSDGSLQYDVRRRDPATNKSVYLKRHATIADCVKALKARFPTEKAKFSETSLRIPEGKGDPVLKRKYEGISQELRKGRLKWRTRPEYGGDYFDKQEDAAAHVAATKGCSVEEITLIEPVYPIQSLALQQQDFREGVALFKDALPGDAVDNDNRADSQQCWESYRKYPGIIPSFLIAKYTQDRDDILESCDLMQWDEMIVGATTKDEEEILYEILLQSARAIAKHRWPSSWINNVGKTNYHWMTFHKHLQKLGMLTEKRSPNSTGEVLIFQASGTENFVEPFSEKVRNHLKTQIEFGKGCMRQVAKRPRTGQEYLDCHEDIDLKNKKPLSGAAQKKCYTRLWLKRGFLRWMLRSTRTKLEVRRMTVRDFFQVFPDEHGRLLPLLGGHGMSRNMVLAQKMGPALKNLQYKEDVDLLTMFSCNLHHSSVVSLLWKREPGWIRRNRAKLEEMKVAFFEAEAIYQCPATLFEGATHLW